MHTITGTTYNATKKKYQVLTSFGELVAEFPSGPSGKLAAEREAIRHDSAAIYDEAQHWQAGIFRNRHDIHGRLWRAARIAASRQVFERHPLSPAGLVCYVASQSEAQKFHQIRQIRATGESGRYQCSCQDYELGRAPTLKGQALCKHILALKLSRATDQELQKCSNILRYEPSTERTGAPLTVIGVWRNGRPVLYDATEKRPAVAGEIVEFGDEATQIGRIVSNHNGQTLRVWRVALPAPLRVEQEETPRPPSRYGGLDNIEAAERARKHARNNLHNRGVRELQRQQATENAVKAYEAYEAYEEKAWAKKANDALFGAE